ncbi:MAG: cyclic nucleotide-binding domain-containing protein [Deltaproteobacteria bacterium]|nr:cyclic nucleotide-binding domain-containing protein [Deltaproteobacteria bacterium]
MKIPLIPHNSKMKIGWDFVMIVAVFASGLIIPYRMVSGQDPADFLYWLITILFCLDIVVIFSTEVKTGLGVLVDRKSVARHYLRTWFVLDLLAALPLAPVFYLFVHEDVSGTLAYQAPILFRLLRLLKLVKISTTFKALTELVTIPPALLRLIVSFFWFALIAHFISLGWIVIGAGEAARSFGDQYIRALYWCITTIATIGYGDYGPSHDSNLQIIYTIIVQIIGVGMFGYIIGNVATLIVNIDKARADFRKKMEEVGNYMRTKHIPAPIRDRVQNYYNYLWETRKGITDVDFMTTLPRTLRLEISLYLNRGIIEKVSLFKDTDETFIHEVIEELEPLVFLPGDFVIRQGELGDCMYFLSSGSVEVIANEKRIAVLTEGSPFGEAALIQNEKRNASVRALSYCDVYKLSQHSFHRLRKKHPEFDKRVTKIAVERQKKADNFKGLDPEQA